MIGRPDVTLLLPRLPIRRHPSSIVQTKLVSRVWRPVSFRLGALPRPLSRFFLGAPRC